MIWCRIRRFILGRAFLRDLARNRAAADRLDRALREVMGK